MRISGNLERNFILNKDVMARNEGRFIQFGNVANSDGEMDGEDKHTHGKQNRSGL